MSYGAEVGATVAATALAEAIKASGAIIKVDTQGFKAILLKNNNSLVVQAKGGLFSKSYQYLTAYKGFIFFTKSATQLELPSNTELILAKKIWIPS